MNDQEKFVFDLINDLEIILDDVHYDFGYENVLFTENAGRSGKRITAGFGGKGVDKGIRTTRTVKSVSRSSRTGRTNHWKSLPICTADRIAQRRITEAGMERYQF